MGHESEIGKYRLGERPSSLSVLVDALSLLEPDGSLRIYDPDIDGIYVAKPEQPVNLDNLPPEKYGRHLYDVAIALEGTCSHIACWPNKSDSKLENLATYLTAYHHAPLFLLEAASLVKTDARGIAHAVNWKRVEEMLSRKKWG